MNQKRTLLSLAVVLVALSCPGLVAQEAISKTTRSWPLVLSEGFDNGMDGWDATDVAAWKTISETGNRVLSLFKASDYEPAVRSPFNIALIRESCVSDFVLEAKLKSTSREYGHRDMCVIFGWQSPSRFYYAHIASKADPHANSIFLVNDKPRLSIATERTQGTRWIDGNYHTIRLIRDTRSGTIAVYFDGSSQPIMVAGDKTFLSGRVGFGSFDDTGNVDDVRLWGAEGECVETAGRLFP